MNRTLNHQQWCMLQRILQTREPDFLHLIDRRDLSRISAHDISDMIELAGDEFIQRGIGDDWEPDAVGIEIEDLIDVLCTYL